MGKSNTFQKVITFFRGSLFSTLYGLAWVVVVSYIIWALPWLQIIPTVHNLPGGIRLLLRLLFTFGSGLLTLLLLPSVVRNSWYVIAALLAWIWCLNAWGHPAKFVVLGLVLVGYFVLEGAERAVIHLSDKDLSQLQEIPTIKTLMGDIAGSPRLFYDSREWISVGLAVGLAIASNFQPLRIPFLSNLDHPDLLSTVFNVLFTTFFLVWIAQAPSKKLALENSVGFLAFSKFASAWPAVRAFGRITNELCLDRPSEMIAGLIGHSKLLKTRFDILPSMSAYFMHSLRIYGYAYYRSYDKLQIRDGGAGRCVNRGVLYVASGDLDRFPRNFYFSQQFNVVSARAWTYLVPRLGERPTKEFEDAMTAICDEEQPSSSHFRRHNAPVMFQWEDVRSRPEGGYQRDFTLSSFARAIEMEGDALTDDQALAIGYEIVIDIAPGGFKFPPKDGSVTCVTDIWTRKVPFPWRMFEVEVTLDDGVAGYLRDVAGGDVVTVDGVHNRRESKRIKSESLGVRGVRKSCEYPLIGGSWRTEWEIWPENVSAESEGTGV